MPERPDFASYKEWAKDILDRDLDNPKYRQYYDTNITSAHSSVQQSKFIQSLIQKLGIWAKEYKLQTGSELFSSPYELTFKTKSYSSVINKSYRLNIAWNKRFPKAPHPGWYKPETWFDYLDDLIRGMLICRYADGPQFVARQIELLARESNLEARSKSLELDDGYYAFHVYVILPVDVANFEWQPMTINISVEIQLTTLLQEVLRDLSHTIYDTNRISGERDRKSWKWDFSSREFQIGYISHSLHFIEGLLVHHRDELMRNNSSNNHAEGESV